MPPNGAAPPAPDPSDRRALGILCMLLQPAVFGGINVILKYLSAEYPVAQMMFFRFFFGLVPAAVVLIHGGEIRALLTRRPGAHIVRGSLGAFSTALLYFAFSRLSATDTIAIFFGTPFIVLILSALFLGERVGWQRWLAVGVGFSGVLTIVKPDFSAAEIVSWAALAAFVACVCYALVSVLLRDLARTDSTLTIVFYYALFGSVVSGAFLPFDWVTPNGADLALLAGIGLLGGTAQFFLTAAFRLAPASVVAPFDYSQLLWTAVIAFIAIGEVPGLATGIGAALIVGSGLYLLHRDSVRRR